jgi:hypothetical protein
MAICSGATNSFLGLTSKTWKEMHPRKDEIATAKPLHMNDRKTNKWAPNHLALSHATATLQGATGSTSGGEAIRPPVG